MKIYITDLRFFLYICRHSGNARKDISLIATHFIDVYNKKTGKKVKGFSREANRIFFDYDWPGNVRELENAIEHAFVLCEGQTIDLSDLPAEIRNFDIHNASRSISNIANQQNVRYTRRKMSREYLETLLETCDWNKAEVSRRSGWRPGRHLEVYEKMGYHKLRPTHNNI